MIKLVFGQETLLANRFLSQIKAQLAPTHSLSVIDCTKDSFEALQAAMTAPSLFASKTLFLFLNPFSSPTFLANFKEASKEFLGSGNAFVFFQEGEASKGSALFRFAKNYGEVHEFSKLSLAEQVSFVQKEASRQGVEMSREACQELVRRVPHDLWRVVQEVKKLAAFQGKAAGAVTQKEIALLVHEEVESEIFAMLDALAKKERKKTTELLAKHIAQGQAPLYLFSMVLYQLRLLLLVKELQEQNMRPQDMAKMLQSHPFAVKKALEAAGNFSFIELKELYRRAFSLEVALKTGKGDSEQLLFLFLGQAALKKNAA